MEINYKAGDSVRLRLAKEELDGVVLESPDASVLLLKLNSGYNIGIPKENILAGRVLKKFAEEKVKVNVLDKKGLPSIGMIVTGGTIATKLDSRTGGIYAGGFSDYQRFYPELFEIANVIIESPFMFDSSSMTSEHWKKIAESVERMLNDKEISGVIVAHGTDTLHYTAAALSFFLRNLNKPVVLTYSQRSIDRASSDANLNLQCAARMAISDCAEVMLVGHASTNDDFCFAMRGTKVRKLHTSRRDAFKSVNELPIAKVWPNQQASLPTSRPLASIGPTRPPESCIEFLQTYRKRNNEKVELDLNFSDKVALLKFYPGQDPDILDFYALKHKGIVIEAGGLGQLPTSDATHNWIPKLKKHIKNGFVVCIASQCVFGRVDPYVYSNARELLDAGAIFLEDMLPETAFVKLGWVLGHYGWKAHVKEKMLENFAGEFRESLPYES